MAITRGVVILAVVGFLVLGIAIGWLCGYFIRNGPCLDGVSHYIIQDGDTWITDRFFNELRPENIRENLRQLTSRPHLAGTPADLEQARTIQKYWRDQGLENVKIIPYRVLLSYPDRMRPNKIVLSDGTGRPIYTSQLVEKILSKDQNQADVIPPFNAYSAFGSPMVSFGKTRFLVPVNTAIALHAVFLNIAGDLVYVNYGRLEDFQFLKERKMIDFRGKICIARYGKIFRGDKVRHAQMFGAIGLILYTDPADYAVNGVRATFPHSWWLPGSGVQRGTTIMEGDPLTPGYPATNSAYRVPHFNTTLPRIPVHPIGYDDAMRFLQAMRGEDVPRNWRGRLPIPYRIGPGFQNADWKIQMHISTHLRNVTTYNVIGFLKGAVEPDRYVLLGNHRDAWVFGALDPSSGTSVMLEMARAMGQMVVNGWRPRRSIGFISWGAEEYGLVGSEEMVEQYGQIFAERTVAYLNVDIAMQGNYTFRAKALPMMAKPLYDVARKVPNPNRWEFEAGRRTLFDTWALRTPKIRNANNKHNAHQNGVPRVPVLGSGSDYAPFVEKLGVTCADIRYTYDERLGISSYPLYHSAYETFQLVNQIMDPEFKYHVAVGQFWGELARYLAESLVLPFDVMEFSETLTDYTHNINAMYGHVMNAYGLSTGLHYLNEAVTNFTTSVHFFKERLRWINRNNPLEVRMYNDQMMALQKAFIDPQGLPGRPLKRNVMFAPSMANTYASSRTFPGLIDTLYQIERSTLDRFHRWEMVKKQLSIITHFIDSASYVLRDVTREFGNPDYGYYHIDPILNPDPYTPTSPRPISPHEGYANITNSTYVI